METKVDARKANSGVKELLLFIPNVIKLFYRLVGDPRVPAREKAILLAAAAYMVSPVDLLLDVIPFLGQVDDLLLAALILKRFMNQVDEEVLYDYWDGNQDILQFINRALSYTRYILPNGLYDKVVGRVEKMEKSAVDYIDVEFERR